MKYFFFFLFLTTIVSCDVEKYITADLGKAEASDSTMIYGRFFDNHFHFPVKNAQVRLMSHRTETDEFGRYQLPIPFLSDYQRNYKPLIIVSKPGFVTLTTLIDVYPEPFSLSGQLINRKPFIMSNLRHDVNENRESVLVVRVLDYQGVGDIASVLLRSTSRKDGNIFYIPFSLFDTLSANEGAFRCEPKYLELMDRRRLMLLLATDKDGFADTLVVPPKSL